jgi:phage replication O-like protein O
MKLEKLVGIINNEKGDGGSRFTFPMWERKGELSGFTQIPNRFLLAIPKLKLAPTEVNLLLVLYRLTLGYGKKSRAIKQVKLMEYLDVSKVSVSKAIKNLKGLGVISYQSGIISLHDVDEWNFELICPEVGDAD